MSKNSKKDNKRKKSLLLEKSSGKKSSNKQDNKNPGNSNKTNQEKIPFSKKIYNVSPFKGLSLSQEKELAKRLVIILGVLFIAVLLTLYTISSFSKLEKIVINGADKADLTQIVEESGLEVGENLWPQYLNRKKDMSSVVENVPRIKSASLKLKHLNQFFIKVSEYPAIAIVENKGVMHPVLENGVVLSDKADKSEQDLPVFLNFEEGEGLTEFLAAYEEFDPDVKAKITSIESKATKTNPFRIEFKMSDGNEVIGLSTTIADKMAFYDKIAEDMGYVGVIDMEAGASGVYSYQLETESSEENESTDESENEYYE